MEIKRNEDNWWDIFIGTFFSYLFLYVVFNLVLIYFKVDIKNNMILLIIPLIYTFFEQWKSNHFSKITTNFTAKKNSEILENVLKKLNWESYINHGEIKIRKSQILNYPIDTTFKIRSKTILIIATKIVVLI